MGQQTLESVTRSNAIRSALLVLGFPFVLPSVIFTFALTSCIIFGQRNAFAIAGQLFFFVLVAMAIITVVWLPIGYLINQWIIDKVTGARLLGRNELPRLWSIFEALCAKCGMRLPALRLIETEALNAFASGLREGSYSVTVTSGLLVALNDDEIEAVLAHELAHIRNHDVRLLVVATVLVGTIPMLHDLITKVFWGVVMGFLNLYRAIFTVIPVPFAKLLVELSYTAMFWIGKLIAYVIGIVGTVSSLVIHFALSRRREFMADAGAVEITGKPEALISALRRISGNSTLNTGIDGVKAMLFESAAFGFGGLFATHPPIERRIEALARLAEAHRLVAPAPLAAATIAPDHPERYTTAPRQSSVPIPDPAAVERYRLLLLKTRPETLDIEGRQQFYRRVRQVVQQGQERNPTIAASDLAMAELCLEAAIRQIEALIVDG